MTAWIAQVRSGLVRAATHEAARGASLSVAIKVIGSALNVLMLTLLARSMAHDAFGVFALWFNAVSLLAVVAGCGQEKLIVRSWNEYVESGRPGLARGALAFGMRVAVAAPVLVAALVLIYGLIAGTKPALLLSACLFLVLQSLFFFSSHATRAIVGIGFGDGHEITWRVIVIAGATAAMMLRTPLHEESFFALANAGLVLAIVLQLVAARSRLPASVRVAPREAETADWSARSVRMWSAAMLEAANQYLEVIVVGLVLSPTVAGGYFVAVRLANAFAMITGGLYNYSTRQISRLHYSNNRPALIESLRVMSRMTAVLVGVGVGAVVLGGHELLSLFGAAFVDTYPLLLILSCGTAVVALIGPAPAILLLTGHEFAYSRIVLVSVAIRCLGILLLAPMLGGVGAALASAGGLAVMAIALNMACRRLAGIDASPLILLPGVAEGLAPAPAAFMPVRAVEDGASGSHAGLRIVLLQTQAENAGAQEVSRILGNALAAKGYEVHPVFLFRRTGGFDAEPNVAFCAGRRPSNPLALALLLWRLFKALRRIRPDAVLCFQHYGNVIGAPVARLAGVRRVIINQNSAPLTTPGLARRLDRWLGASGLVERIVVNSADTQADYAGYPRPYVKRMVRIDHGFELKASRMTRAEARAAFGLPAGNPLLGCVARLHPQKRLDAAIRLLPLQPSWHLALAGQGAAENDLRALAATLGCAERVHFVGELATLEVGNFLAALDVFVFPSLAETFGLAAVEAAAAGVPVVANRLPVLREVLAVDGQPCALFVDVDDPAAFAGAVAEILDDRGLARELSERGRRLAQRYPASAMADGYDALLRGAASPVPARQTP